MINNLVLIGITGVGKTTIGRLIAEGLDKEFIDLDKSIELRCGVDIPTIFEIEGEDGFRMRESSELKNILTKKDNYVLSVGGGCVISKQNRELITNSGNFVVQLFANIPAVVDRLSRAPGKRPLLQDVDPLTKITRLYEKRKPFYDEVANLTIDTTDLLPSQTAAIVIKHLKNNLS